MVAFENDVTDPGFRQASDRRRRRLVAPQVNATNRCIPAVPAPTIKILGRLELVGNAGSIHLVRRKERQLLLALLVHRNRQVVREALIDALWSENLPSDPAASLRSYASIVHRAVESVSGVRFTSRRTGYTLSVDETIIDAVQLAELVERAEALRAVDANLDAGACLDTASSLIRGMPLEEAADAPFAAAEVARLRNLVVYAQLLRLEVHLVLGRYDELIDDARALVSGHPYDEHLWELYASGLYRAGRTKAALATINRIRLSLRNKFGIDLSPSLTLLEANIRLASIPGSNVRRSGSTPSAPTDAATTAPGHFVPSSESRRRRVKPLPGALGSVAAIQITPPPVGSHAPGTSFQVREHTWIDSDRTEDLRSVKTFGRGTTRFGADNPVVRVLGPLLLDLHHDEVPLARRKARELFLKLLIHRGTSISISSLVRALWEGDLPEDPPQSIRSYVSTIRRWMEAWPLDVNRPFLRRASGGYRLDLDDDYLDLVHFTRLISRGRTALQDGLAAFALRDFNDALNLFRGEPLQDASSCAFAFEEITRIKELRLQARQDRALALLDLGRVNSAIADLTSLTEEQPWLRTPARVTRH